MGSIGAVTVLAAPLGATTVLCCAIALVALTSLYYCGNRGGAGNTRRCCKQFCMSFCLLPVFFFLALVPAVELLAARASTNFCARADANVLAYAAHVSAGSY